MLFTPEQIQELLNEVHRSILVYSVSVVGESVLTETDKAQLKQWGVNTENLKQQFPEVDQSFMFGILTGYLDDKGSSGITYKDFLDYLKSGRYIPISPVQQSMMEIARRRTYHHITTLEDGIKKDINNAIIKTEQEKRVQYEKIIQKEIEEGVKDRKGYQQIVSEIGHKTGDWQRNLGRIVETEMNTVFQEGRASAIQEKFGVDAKVFKDVYPGACRHCIRLYLTGGIGSEPRTFTLKQLMENGTNIGRKVNEWKPVVDSTHPNCRCNLQHRQEGTVWDEEKNMFVYPPEREEFNKPGHGRIHIKVGDKEYWV